MVDASEQHSEGGVSWVVFPVPVQIRLLLPERHPSGSARSGTVRGTLAQRQSGADTSTSVYMSTRDVKLEPLILRRSMVQVLHVQLYSWLVAGWISVQSGVAA